MNKTVHYAIGVLTLMSFVSTAVCIAAFLFTDREIWFGATVFSLTLTICGTVVFNIWQSAIENEPIILTEKRLLKAGFKCIWSGQGEGETFESKYHNVILCRSHGGKTFTYPRYSDGGGNHSVKITYEHEIQDLYFALTKENLIFLNH